jgi:hypothetical protein
VGEIEIHSTRADELFYPPFNGENTSMQKRKHLINTPPQEFAQKAWKTFRIPYPDRCMHADRRVDLKRVARILGERGRSCPF